MKSLLWLRRDLRRTDHPALVAAARSGPSGVVPVFVVDPVLVASAGPARRIALREVLCELREAYDGALVVEAGDPADVLPRLARRIGAGSVHVSAETTPYGRSRDARVERALAARDVPLVVTGSPYAVTPGRVRSGSGDPYKVFTPFSRAWRDHGWRRPAPEPPGLRWVQGLDGVGLEDLATALPVDRTEVPPRLPPVGGSAALERWREFLDGGLTRYGTDRDRPDLDATSRMSVHLKYGTVHPRTLLADVADHPDRDTEGARRLVTELCWREFYADVLWHDPDSAWSDLRPTLVHMDYDDVERDPAAAERFGAWQEGRTGYPLVDAGMRQLLTEGWMHNRVRMVTASFLVKDLHVWWVHGARHFLQHLVDGDVASNNHGWQWVAGTGTDAAPYFRVFNPVTQGERFDPDGAYVRRYVPELRHLRGKAAHQPWRVGAGYDHGYPRQVVDHATERREALARYEAARRT